MTFNYIPVLFLFVAVNAGIIQVSQHPRSEYQPGVYQQTAPKQRGVLLPKRLSTHEEYFNDPHARYSFEYIVKDAVSGDFKSQTETGDGDVVQGEYSLIDADGFRRIVKYTADNVNGFNAIVHCEPVSNHKLDAIPHAAPINITPVDSTQDRHKFIFLNKASYDIPVHHINHSKQSSQTHSTNNIPQYKARKAHYNN